LEEQQSGLAELKYWTNICICTSNFGEFLLQFGPRGAFFPDTEEKAGLNAIEELLVNGTFDFDCAFHMGMGTVIFQHAKRLAQAN